MSTSVLRTPDRLHHWSPSQHFESPSPSFSPSPIRGLVWTENDTTEGIGTYKLPSRTSADYGRRRMHSSPLRLSARQTQASSWCPVATPSKLPPLLNTPLSAHAYNLQQSAQSPAVMTPLASNKRKSGDFETLAPLPAPKFMRKPQASTDTERSLHAGADFIHNLSIVDLDADVGNASIESISPSGHVLKRRITSRNGIRSDSSTREGRQDTASNSPASRRRPIPAARTESCATLFFGPKIPQPQGLPTPPKTSPAYLEEDPFSSFDEGSFTEQLFSPSPPRKPQAILKKFKPRDSGVALCDTDCEGDSSMELPPLDIANSSGAVTLDASSSSMTLDDPALTTPLEPSMSAGWPVLLPHGDEDELSEPEAIVDAFIHQAIATGGGMSKDSLAIPDTPVKRNPHAGVRPWKTVAPAKPRLVLSPLPAKAPRKSMPLTLDMDYSPSARKSFGDIRQRRLPPVPLFNSRVQRSGSGVSTCSDASTVSTDSFGADTPTHGKQDIKLTAFKLPGTGSQTLSPVGSVASPAYFVSVPRRRSSTCSAEERSSYFDQAFIVDSKLGAGEFGNAWKVKYIEGNDDRWFAIKRSKQFEGPKHRLRLREEVDILKRLSSLARPSGHPNVLGYVDSWEQEESLFIQTELCDGGNFADFLESYGSQLGRLDEARVWKILVELGNGLLFIHNAGVIHLDFKPANIFITSNGQFRIGDFGMASEWPRVTNGGFEREGDRNYLAAEVLQGRYGSEADIFSFGMTILETATNIRVPEMGEPWHSLRHDDFSEVDFECSDELFELVCRGMMCSRAENRPSAEKISQHAVVVRARDAMRAISQEEGGCFSSSALGRVPDSFLDSILGCCTE